MKEDFITRAKAAYTAILERLIAEYKPSPEAIAKAGEFLEEGYLSDYYTMCEDLFIINKLDEMFKENIMACMRTEGSYLKCNYWGNEAQRRDDLFVVLFAKERGKWGLQYFTQPVTADAKNKVSDGKMKNTGYLCALIREVFSTDSGSKYHQAYKESAPVYCQKICTFLELPYSDTVRKHLYQRPEGFIKDAEFMAYLKEKTSKIPPDIYSKIEQFITNTKPFK